MTRDDFRRKFTKCFLLCGSDGTDVHEIARGSFRQKALEEPATWLKVCRPCHDGDLEFLTIAQQLAYKLINDPANYDRLRVNELRRRAPNSVSERDVAVEVARIFQGFRQGINVARSPSHRHEDNE